MGYLITEDNTQKKRVIEYDTVSCPHCQAIIKILKRQAQLGGFCPQCMSPICLNCAKLKRCTPFLKQVDEQLTRQARRRACPV